MCTFATPPEMAIAAIELQRQIRDARVRGELPPYLGVRVGFHFGPVLCDGPRIFGDTVYVARRMASLAKTQQILTSAQTVRIAIGVGQTVRFVDRTRIKGREEPFKVYEILWDPEIATVTGTQASLMTTTGAEPPRLIVSYNDEEFQVDPARPRLTIGRDAGCDIKIEDSRVSRLHARIEFRKTSFYLSDESTNGTFLFEGGNETPIRLHRRAHRLEGEGSVLLSRPGRGKSLTLQYRTDRPDGTPSREDFTQEIG